jgi:hypothetical protein
MACAWSSSMENGSQQFALLRINAKFAVEPDLTLARPSTCSKFSSFPTNGRKSICRQWTTTNTRKSRRRRKRSKMGQKSNGERFCLRISPNYANGERKIRARTTIKHVNGANNDRMMELSLSMLNRASCHNPTRDCR